MISEVLHKGPTIYCLIQYVVYFSPVQSILLINTINNPTTDADLKPLMMSMYLLGMLRVPGPLTIHHCTIWFTVCETWVKTGGKSNFISKEPKILFSASYLHFVSSIMVSIKWMQSIPTSLPWILPSFKVQWFCCAETLVILVVVFTYWWFRSLNPVRMYIPLLVIA